MFGPVHVRFMVDSVAPGQGFLRVSLFSPVSTIPLILYSRLHLPATLTRRTNGRSMGPPPPPNAISFGNRGALDRKLLLPLIFRRFK
jgi:hypothetical protein